jgi:hypothetical protein
MNIDDPKLTAYALGELPESQRAEVERFLTESSEAENLVRETKEFARLLQEEYSGGKAAPGKRANLIDIGDDPWFWSRARPLGIAAVITIFALVGAIMIGTYKSRRDSAEAGDGRFEYADVEREGKAQPGAPEIAGPDEILNPIPADTVGRIERVVIGQVIADSRSNGGEIQILETINDPFRVQRLKDRLTTPALAKKSHRAPVTHTYELMFLDGGGQVLAAASFYYVPGSGFVLQPSKYGREVGGHYFINDDNPALPGNWQSETDYRGYVIPFPDWGECIGYSPGV